MDALSRLNEVAPDDAEVEFLACCGSRRWVQAMVAGRPFVSAADLHAAAESVWNSLDPEDWRQAFAAHPRIGDRDALRQKFGGKGWEAREQSGASTASDEALDALAQANRDYEERHGFIFIVCATGKTADEMLGILQARLPNDPERELKIAAAEQAKITRLRLEKLLS